jgi:hypothetical protein
VTLGDCGLTGIQALSSYPYSPGCVESGILRSALHSYAPVFSPEAEVDRAFRQQGLMAEQPSGVNSKSVGGLKARPTKPGRS